MKRQLDLLEILVVYLLMIAFGFLIANIDLSFYHYYVIIPFGVALGSVYLLRRSKKARSEAMRKTVKVTSIIVLVFSILTMVATIALTYWLVKAFSNGTF